MKRMGEPFCEKILEEPAFSNTSRTSLTPAVTAERVKNSLSRVWAMILASVVFPTPGGPQSMKDERFPDSIILESTEPGPTR